MLVHQLRYLGAPPNVWYDPPRNFSKTNASAFSWIDYEATGWLGCALKRWVSSNNPCGNVWKMCGSTAIITYINHYLGQWPLFNKLFCSVPFFLWVLTNTIPLGITYGSPGLWSLYQKIYGCTQLPSGNFHFNIAMENEPFIVDLPIKSGDCPLFFVCLPEGIIHL